MKREGNLYERIISVQNIRLADYRAQRGKKKQRDVIIHNSQKEKNIIKLHNTLKEERYETSRYHNFIIREPKIRKISRLPYFMDRILHWAIINVIGKILTNCLIAQTYSCIKGRGIHRCLRDVKKAIQGGGVFLLS